MSDILNEETGRKMTTIEMLANVTNEELADMARNQTQPIDILETQDAAPVVYNPQYAIVMSNALIRGKMPMETRESKIFRLLVSQVQPDDTEFKVFQISLSTLAKILNISSVQSLRRDIRKVVSNLLSQQVWVCPVDGDGNVATNASETLFNLFEVCQIESSNYVKFKLSDYLRPYLTQLTGNYTQYPIYLIGNFTSAHAIRIYEILQMSYTRSYKRSNVFSISLEGLKAMLTSGDTDLKKNPFYPDNNSFKRRVLDVAVEQINANLLTDFTVSYVLDKEGTRSFQKVIFTIKPRNYSKENGNITPEVVEAARKALLLQTQIDAANAGEVKITPIDPNAPVMIADASYMAKAVQTDIMINGKEAERIGVGKTSKRSKKANSADVAVLDIKFDDDDEMPPDIANATFEEITAQLNLFDMGQNDT